MRKWGLMMLMACGMAVPAIAQETGGNCTGGQCPATRIQVAATQECEGSCPVTAGMNLLPKISYIVGDEAICCGEMAKAKSEETGASVVYVVGDRKFDDEKSAFTSLVEQTEQFVSAFAEPRKCDVSGLISIGGKSCDCAVKAGEMKTAITAAMKTVNTSYKVGDHTCNCPTEAAELAARNKAELRFVVGESETCCPLEARLNLAKARYKAALMAINPTTETAGKTETSSRGSGG